jgi:AcrR family transcriptional regulator
MATYRTGIQTNQKIVDAARKLFSKDGISKTTYARIAEAADVDISSIVYHFKSFDKLLLIIRDQMALERREIIRKKIGVKYPGESFSESLLYAVEFRIAIDLYIRYKPYYNFFKDVYFRIQHLSFDNSVIHIHVSDLNMDLSDTEKIMYECLFKPFQYMVPEFVHVKKCDITGKEIADFYARLSLSAYQIDNDYIENHINKRNEIAESIEIKCGKNFILK